MMIEDRKHPLTASFGASFFLPGMNVTAEALIRAADDALYAAKHQGRNRTVVAPCKDIEVPSLAG
jgi:PleD family two-component response regulator